MQPTFGYYVPSLATLAQYHPQVALAVLSGYPLRPNVRPLSVQLQNSQLGNPQPASFDTVISQYSIFSGVSVTIDPTNNLVGNPFELLSDAAQPLTSGITVSMLVKSNDGVDYAPVPDETPLQSLPIAFAPSVGTWFMRNPENIKLSFTLQTAFPGPGPITVWTVWTFLVLASAGESFVHMDTPTARAQLQQMGLWPTPRAA